jgi:hypothetical protein
MTQSPHSDRQRRRKEMTDDIIQRVRDAIHEELAGAPQNFNVSELEEIDRTILGHTQQVVDALSTEEMRSEGALLSHIANARTETNRRIRERRPTDGPAKTT